MATHTFGASRGVLSIFVNKIGLKIIITTIISKSS